METIDLGGNLSFTFGKSKLTQEERVLLVRNGDIPKNTVFVVGDDFYVGGKLCYDSREVVNSFEYQKDAKENSK